MVLSTGTRSSRLRLGLLLTPALLAALLAACGTPAATPTRAPVTTPVTTAPPAAKPTVSGTAAPATTPLAPASTPAAGAATAGRTVFQTNCDSCHPGGRQGVGPALTGAVNRLGESGIRDIIRKGRPGTAMPAFAENRINPTQLEDLVAYLKSL